MPREHKLVYISRVEESVTWLMYVVRSTIENGPWLWQATQFYSVPLTGVNEYYQFCDYIEVCDCREMPVGYQWLTRC